MAGGAVDKYQFTAKINDGVIEWSLGLHTDDGEKYHVTITQGEEIPVLHTMLRNDSTVYYDAKAGTLRTGWNTPGKE